MSFFSNLSNILPIWLVCPCFFCVFNLTCILCTWSYLVVLDDVVVVEGDELADDSEEEPEQEEAPPQPV